MLGFLLSAKADPVLLLFSLLLRAHLISVVTPLHIFLAQECNNKYFVK